MTEARRAAAMPVAARGPFAVQGSAEFNRWLGKHVDALTYDVHEVLGSDLKALILGGGYGRGEGAIDSRGGWEAPYNDLDLFLVLGKRRPRAHLELQELRHRHAQKLGIEVDFSRGLTMDDVRRLPRRLMWFDLLQGHHVLYGDPGVLLDHAPHDVCQPLPVIEASRLLINRGTGLLWAMQVSRGLDTALDPDFVRRNYYKCALALGDALLISNGTYRATLRGREGLLHRLLITHPGLRALDIEPLYRRAIHFKLRPDGLRPEAPDIGTLEELAHLWGAVFLHIESQRLKRSWRHLEEYCDWDGVREPDECHPMRWPRNLVQNLRLGTCSVLYPRETLYRQLPRLLVLRRGIMTLGGTEWRAYFRVWDRFN